MFHAGGAVLKIHKGRKFTFFIFLHFMKLM